MKMKPLIYIVILLAVAIFGINPFVHYRDTSDLLDDGYGYLESGVQRRANGVYFVRALTRMPDVKSEMVRWWFADYMQTTEHYKRWHPTAHVWMDWENKTQGEVIEASHLVHEYIGSEMSKLRIQFVDPADFFDGYSAEPNRFVICARVGMLEQAINVTSMCHIVRDTPWGAEMRSAFWLGHVSQREGNEEIASILGFLGNTALARMLLVDKEFAVDLMTHAIQEMGYLADFLPDLYTSQRQIKGK
ncbi:MAG: hypothetical protein AAF542_22765 [Pseudomonadota bacterium]